MYPQQFSYQIILNTSQLMRVVDGTLIAFVLQEGIKGSFRIFTVAWGFLKKKALPWKQVNKTAVFWTSI